MCVAVVGLVSSVAGLADVAGSVDGQGSVARFRFPPGVAVSSWGDLFVADHSNHMIRRLTSTGSCCPAVLGAVCGHALPAALPSTSPSSSSSFL